MLLEYTTYKFVSHVKNDSRHASLRAYVMEVLTQVLRKINWLSLIGFRVRWYVFRSVFSDLELSSLTTVAALVR
jgi:hypothetical protein